MPAPWSAGRGGTSHRYTYDVATGTFTPIASLGADNSTATGINDQGMVTGFYNDGDGDTASFVDNSGVFTTFELFKSHSTQAFGINNTGAVVGSWTGHNHTVHGFVWRAGMAFNVGDPNGANQTIVNGVNNGGSLVGFYTNAGGLTVGFVGVPSVTQP